MTRRDTDSKNTVKFEEIFEDKDKKKKTKRKRKLLVMIIISIAAIFILSFTNNLLKLKYEEKSNELADQVAHVVYMLRDADENKIESEELVKNIEEYFAEDILINYIEIKNVPEDRKYSKEELCELEDIEYRYPSESTKREKRIDDGQTIKIDGKNIFLEYGIEEVASKERHDFYEVIIKSLMAFLLLILIFKLIVSSIKERYKIINFAIINGIIVGIIFVFLKIKNLI